MSSLINPNADNLASLLGSKDGQPSLKELMKAQQESSSNVNDSLPERNSFQPSKQGLKAVSAMKEYQSSYSYSETMSLKLQTKEGDTITVDFRQLYAQYEQHKSEMYTENSPSGARYFESTSEMEATHFEEQFGFSVQGDINEDELKAIFSVFEQVDELANNFFDGNIEKAFEQAVEMEIDFSQLQSVELNLQQTETYAKSYTEVAGYEKIENANENGERVGIMPMPADNKPIGSEVEIMPVPSISDLPPYLQKLQNVITELDKQFDGAQGILDEFVASVASYKFPEQDDKQGWLDRVSEFHKQLLEKIDSNIIEQTDEENSLVEDSV
jgi:hypothetical protein